MILLHNIDCAPGNSNYNTIDEILACDEPLSFDGVYRSVYKHRHDLVGKDITLFVTGNYVGGDNRFDTGEALEEFCGWNEIMEIVELTGAKLGWHTWSHRDLTTLTPEEIRLELTPPFPMDEVAYPYGEFDENVLGITEDLGYKNGWSVTQGDDTKYQLNRAYL